MNPKPLFTFATKLNYTRFNVAAALKNAQGDTALASRILKQTEALKLINCPKLSVRARIGFNQDFAVYKGGTDWGLDTIADHGVKIIHSS